MKDTGPGRFSGAAKCTATPVLQILIRAVIEGGYILTYIINEGRVDGSPWAS
jgi:hypothetical protein